MDQALTALITDLHDRGLDKNVLVVACGEFGRTPRVTHAPTNFSNQVGLGRDHWPHGFSIAMAGGGIQGGRVVGETSPTPKQGSKQPTEDLKDARPIEDIHATILDAMGVDFTKELPTPIGRPMVVSQGKAIAELF